MSAEEEIPTPPPRPTERVSYMVTDAQGNIVRSGRCPRGQIPDQAGQGEQAFEAEVLLDDRLYRIVNGRPVAKHTAEDLERSEQARRAKRQATLHAQELRHRLRHAVALDSFPELDNDQRVRLMAWIQASDEPETTLEDILGTTLYLELDTRLQGVLPSERTRG